MGSRCLVSRLGFSAALVAQVSLMSGCPAPLPVGEPLKPPTTGEAFAGVQCSAVRPQTEPDLMAWDSGSRSNLNRLRREGVVAVRYEAKGCNVELELLSNCIAPGAAYKFSPYAANEHKVARNASELFAQLPVGAARLSGSLKGDRVLRTDYMLAGQYALPPGTTLRASELKGDCARATHAVSAVYVGAFAMAAGESRAMEGGASLLGAGGGVKSSAAVESLGDEGSAEACKASQEAAKENERCAVPLRIGLIAIHRSAAPVAASPATLPAASAAIVAPPPTPPAASVVAPPPPPGPSTASGGMVSVPAGSYLMGSPDGVGSAAEHPQHRVSVAAFAMDVTEVTVADYARCVSAGACSQANADNGFCNYGKSDKASHPINCVDWSQATAYCGWAGKRLPTEEEWEYAARGTDGRTFPWGFSAPSGRLCWDRYKSKQGTCAVGSFPPALFGLRDMAGNVAEWTSNHYSGGQDKNGAIELRRARGGTWRVDSAALVRAAEIYTNLRAYRGSDVGFRCAR